MNKLRNQQQALNLLSKEKNGEFIEQRTDVWYEARKNIFTASEIASLLDCNRYQSCEKTLKRKRTNCVPISNKATEWGNMFEPIAVNFYEKIKKEKVYSLGLVIHDKHKWLGASPDGLLLSGRLLEIKCPIKRKISDKIPFYYWIQMQIQMEVCDIDICDYLECEFYQYPSKKEYILDETKSKNFIKKDSEIIYYTLIKAQIREVERDKKWFNKVCFRLKKLHNDQFKRNVKPRKNSITDSFVSATDVRNYMMDDPILDWIKLGHYKNTSGVDNSIKGCYFNQCMMKRGVQFENVIIKQLINKLGNKVVHIANSHEARSHNKYLETIKHIKKGTPIIYQAVLHDYNDMLYGMPDLLVRADYLHHFDPNMIYSDKLYCVIDIKCIALEITCDGVHLRNYKKEIKAYKAQLYIYNKILNTIQYKITSKSQNKSYILGRTWKYKQNSDVFYGIYMEKLACINFDKNDEFIKEKTNKAIQWVRDVRLNGSEWDVYSREELKPNMCNTNPEFMEIKKEIAHYYNDITLLWNCGTYHRKFAEENGITNWRTEKNLMAPMLGITGEGNINTLQYIIDVNQNTEKTEPYLPVEELSIEWLIQPLPKNIISNMYKWRTRDKLEFFIDFETILPDLLPNMGIKTAFIFMIGIGYSIKGTWHFKCFTAENITLKDEKNIITNMHKFIEELIDKHSCDDPPRLFHWANAEKYLYTGSMNRHPDIAKKYDYLTNWCDLLKLFKSEPIVARGMLNFSLKSLAKAFYENKFIKTKYDSSITNGLDAMVEAVRAYESPHLKKVIKDIEKYNIIDCKLLWEILEFLRK